MAATARRRHDGAASGTVPTALAVLAVVLASALLVTACDLGKRATEGPPALTVGYRDIGAAAPLLVAAAKGLPAGAGFRLAAKRYASDGKLVSAIRSGEITMAVMPVSEAAVLYVDRAAVIIVGATAESFGREGIVTTGSIDSLDELVGKRVAVSSSTGGFFLWAMMTRAGIEPASVEIVTLPYGRLEAALADEEADAVVVSGSALRRARTAEDRRVLLSTEDFPGALADVVVVGRSFAEENAKDLQRVLDAFAAASTELMSEPAAAREAAARESSTTAAQVAAAAAGLRYLSAQDVRDVLGVLGSPGALAQMAEEAVAFEVERSAAQTPPAPQELVDSRYVNPAER